MTHRRHRKTNEAPSTPDKSAPTSAAAAENDSSPAAAEQRPLHEKTTAHLLIGVAFTVAMWGLATWIERAHIHWGIRVREAVYGLIQARIGVASDKVPEVVVVDISTSAPMIAGDGSGPLKLNAKADDLAYTDRTYLRDLVLSILERGPKAIGLDIDFTPYPAQTEDDDRLLACLFSLSTGSRIATELLPSGGIDPLCYQTPSVPIYVATYSSISLGPLYALERPEYSAMAGFAGTVRPDSGEAPRKMVYSISIPYGAAGGPSWQVNSLSSAMYGARADVEAPPLEWAAERLPVTRTQSFRATEFYVNYGAIEDLQKNYTIDACDLIRNRKLNSPSTQGACGEAGAPQNPATIDMKGKYVLIGRTKSAGADEHVVVGHGERKFTGVYLHACAINTLTSGSLLALLLPSGRLILDLSLFFLIFVLVELIRMFVRRKFGWEPSERALHIAVTLCVVAIAIIVGIYGLSRIRLMWDDSPFVGAGLIAHALIGHLLVRF